MNKKIRKIIIGVVMAVVFLGTTQEVFAANIDLVQKYSQGIGVDIDQNGTDDFINWAPSGGGATVTDTGMTGYVWGESLGWINLNPTGSGVTNTCDGDLGGMAWSSVAGWINFSPTGATVAPNINTTTGEITGQIWVSGPHGGWYELASPDGTYPGLITSWRPSQSCNGGGGGGGGGVIGSIPGCKDPLAQNFNPVATVTNGTCIYPVQPPVTPTDPVVPPTPTPNPNPINPTTPPNNPQPNTTPPIAPNGPGVPVSPNSGPIPIISSVIPSTNQNSPYWALVGVLALGLVATIPGMVTRVAHNLITLVWTRRKLRGIVYDSVTKEPLDPVYVSVIDLATNQEVKNQQTDMEGRFAFVLPKGQYKIITNKTHYAFPSTRLAGRASDDVYDRLYYGEPFLVEDEKQVVTMNIPMDPLGTDWNQEEKHKTRFLGYLMNGQTKYTWAFNTLFIIGFIVSIIITYFYPSVWNYITTGLYVVFGLIQVYGYGPVYAGKVTKDGLPLAGAIVRVWSASLNHEVAKRVTEVSGSYYILVPKADYYVTIDQRNQDGTFTKIFTSEVFHARHGCIDKNFKL